MKEKFSEEVFKIGNTSIAKYMNVFGYKREEIPQTLAYVYDFADRVKKIMHTAIHL